MSYRVIWFVHVLAEMTPSTSVHTVGCFIREVWYTSIVASQWRGDES